jgi:hypothetical protein
MAAEPLKSARRRRKAVLHGEELERAVADFLEVAEAEAGRIRNRNRGRVYRRKPERQSNVSALLAESLRGVLEDEVVPAVATPGSKILPTEFERELIKKALVGLKSDGLRTIARRHTLESRGGIEQLATRIGQFYKWDNEAVARLVLENEPEPSPERGHVDRLFLLADEPELEYVARRLEYVIGRYIRIGIAKWFVFEDLDVDDVRVRLRGTLRAYRADVSGETESPTVVPVVRADNPLDVIIDRSGLIRVRRGNLYESSAATEAFAIATQMRPLDYVPLRTSRIRQGAALSFAPASLFMLDLLTARIGRSGIHDRNLTVARFRVDEHAIVHDAENASKPRLHAVRFEGAHLLDSAAACKLLADEGRALVDVSLTAISPPRNDGESARFPIRFAIEHDHVLVMTSFGVVPELSFGMHEAVIAAARDEILEGIADPDGLMNVAERITNRAKEAGPVERADMLRDEDEE